ncbi:amino acid permease [Microcella alkalica]|uniref:APA family basic amino acid/polyamine antiporter n=1 Tax=Microcella alkalica TaxID=355930 RepID=A0A839E825_9MICO|nr:APA family basic amino acid/polyamine antiporter [Microcella alkalica]
MTSDADPPPDERGRARGNGPTAGRPALSRSVGLGGAIGIGLASMIGAGAFYVWAPAAAATGELLLLALLIAALVATLNAFSSAQLAMAHPTSGGAYAFGRHYAGPWIGFSAGWLFVVGKTASAAAIASVAAAYLGTALGLDALQTRLLAAALIAIFAALNMSGVRTTARVAITIVSIVLAGLAAWFTAVAVAGPPTIGWVENLGGLPGQGEGAVSVAIDPADAALELAPVTVAPPAPVGPAGILQAAALLFFAFAGYARMATLGEEVREPRRTLPRAILIALAVVLALYAALALVLVDRLGVEALAASTSPLADAIDPRWALPIALLAALACLGSLAGILAGLSRTSLAMARERDLPGPLVRISTRTGAPVVSEALIALIAIGIALLLQPAQLVAASSAAVLVYYAIAHLSALRQPAAERWQPRLVAGAGLAGCLVLVVSLPAASLIGTAGILAIGLGARTVALRARARPSAGA